MEQFDKKTLMTFDKNQLESLLTEGASGYKSFVESVIREKYATPEEVLDDVTGKMNTMFNIVGEEIVPVETEPEIKKSRKVTK